MPYTTYHFIPHSAVCFGMTDSAESESPVDSAVGAASSQAIEAFATLGNETRLAILLALWEAYEPISGEHSVTFSALRERVGIRDSGQFNYHLDQLTGRFIRSTDTGYELKESGQTLIRTVIAGAGLGETSRPPTDVELPCNRCGAHPVAVSYEEESIYLKCNSCDGFASIGDFPSGTLAVWHLAPAGLVDRDTAELLVASSVAEDNRVRSMNQGVCPDCSGSVTTSVHLCDDHTPGSETVCSNCGRRDSARVRYVCTVCKNWNAVPIQVAVHDHPAVVSFYYERGIDMNYQVGDIDEFCQVWEYLWEQDHAIDSTDPVRVRVTIPCAGDELHVVLDDTLTVIDISEQ